MSDPDYPSKETLDRVTQILGHTLVLGEIEKSTELVDSELLDSVSVVNLILELEKALEIRIPESEIAPENFQTPATIACLCERLAVC